MKNSMARSRPSGRGRNETTRYSVCRPCCVQYSIFSALAFNAPVGRLAIIARIGSAAAGSTRAGGSSLPAGASSSTEPRMVLGR
jgi:hypothetical protein